MNASTRKKPELNSVHKLLNSKQKLVDRLEQEKKFVRADAEKQIAKIDGRIRIAKTLIDALEKGTLKP